MKAPRGIRNNNPGNIRKTASITWVGQLKGNDTAFVTFDTPEHGLRALMKVLRTYQNKHGLETIRGFISRWAPPNENDTEAYVHSVSKDTNIPPDVTIRLERDFLITLAQAIVRHENGHSPEGWPPYWYGLNVYRAAADLAME